MRLLPDLAVSTLAAAGWALLVLPVLVVVGSALDPSDSLTFPPQGLSARWLVAALGSPVFMAALGVSTGLATAAAAIALVLGTLAALGTASLSARGSSLASVLLTAPILLPGMVLGFSIYVFYVASGLGLTGTFTGLLLGHALVATPWVFTLVLAALRRLDPALAEVARSLGAGPIRTFWRVTLPGLLPALVAGAILAFVASFAQFDISLFLGVTDATPLPVAIFTSLMSRGEPLIAAAGVLAIAVVVLALAFVNWLFPVSVLFGGDGPKSR